MKRSIFFLLFLFSLLNLSAQQTVTCGVTSNICYPDPLNCALTNNYADNVTYTETYTSSDGISNLTLVFTAFDVETNFDFLYVYDAANTTDATKLVATYTGNTLPASITSTGASLTLKFTSDGSVTQQGFKATIACLGNQPPTIIILHPINTSSNNARNSDLLIDFSEVVNPVAGKFISIKNASTNALIEQIDANSANVTGGGTKNITIKPSNDLADGTYYVLIDVGAFQDIANADFAGLSNTTDWSFTVRDLNFDGIAGKAVQFAEIIGQPSTYAEVLNNSAFDLQDEFTIEFWTKLAKLKQDQKILGKANNSASKGYLIGFTDGKLFCEFWDTQGKLVELRGGKIKEGKWTHVAINWKKSDGSLIAYLDGIEVARVDNLVNSWGTNTNSLVMGGDSRNTNQFRLDGQMDEIRIWHRQRTIKQIRENMYLTLNGNEHDLTSYWQCNDADNTILIDKKGSFNASLKNAATKVTSTLPVGAGLSETQYLPAFTFTFYTFPTLDITLFIYYENIFRNGEVVVSKINGSPNPSLTKVIAPYTNNYWIIRQYGGGETIGYPIFKFNNFLTSTDKKNDISLFKRSAQSHLDWDFVAEATAVSFANQTVDFNYNYANFFNMQFAISRGNARQLDSLALVSLHHATDGANWKNRWNLSSPMTTWTGVEIENRRVVKVQLFDNNLLGTLPNGLDALSELRILNLRSNKLTGNIPSDFGNLAKLQILNIRDNQLEGFVPATLGNLAELTNLVLGQNNFEELPSFTAGSFKNLQLMSVHTNKLTFEDLTDNVGVFPDFVYVPQQNVNQEEEIQAVEGSTVTIKATVGGDGNQYEWFKDEISLGQPSVKNSYTINNFAGENIGVYYCEITNDKAPDLTLIRNNITIITTLNQADSLVLIALYNATDGANWKNKWDLTTPISTWFGVTLINNSRVVVVKLAGNNLVGILPDDIGNLTEMTLMDLGSNEISGTIPASLGNLKKMRFIFLHNNEFSGTIPSELADMENIEVILLRGNNLIGNLPNSFNNSLKLRRIEVQGNQLTGLPTLSNLSKLEQLSVENNKLTFADIEANIGVTSDFNYFPQDEIDVRQDLSIAWMSNVTFTTTVDGTQNTYQWKKGINDIGISSTDNSFTINDLDYADIGIYTCLVSNPLVPNLVLVRKTITLRIEPPGINQADSLALIALYNSTNGANWQTTWNLQDEVLNWSGVTVKDGRVIKLNLSSNRLIGTLPVELGNITRLEEINFQSNTISGQIPLEIGTLTQLKQLNLSTNKLSGEIPISFSQLSILESMDFSNNKLEGEIPSFWADLPNLFRLHLANNQLTGNVHDDIGSLEKLVELDLSNNQLTGKIPESYAGLHELQALSLANNAFHHLPNLSDLAHLSQLNVNDNLFTFEDLEPNIGKFSVFTYQNQRVRNILPILGDLGQDILLDEFVDGSANLYQWFKNNEEFTSHSTASSLTLPNVDFTDIAVYSLRVANSLVPDLTLNYKFDVKVKPETPHVVTPEPYCYGDTVIVLTAHGNGGVITRWYSDAALTVLLGEAVKIRISLTQDRQTIYATNLASGLESEAEVTEIILRPTIEKQGNTLFIADEGINYQWHFNREAIEGENSNVLTIREDGFYSVTIFTKEGCEATSKNIEIKDGQLILALEDDVLTNDLRIYPNPSQDILNIALNNTYFGHLKIKITNSLGKELIISELQKNSQKLNTSIDISDLANGLYILELNTDTGTFIRKIIKQ